MAKLIDPAGAGRSMVSPGWLTQLGRLWGGASGGVPVADAKPADIADLLGGALFRALFKWMTETGPVYLLPTGEEREREIVESGEWRVWPGERGTPHFLFCVSFPRRGSTPSPPSPSRAPHTIKPHKHNTQKI
jgi:hypothetical protein